MPQNNLGVTTAEMVSTQDPHWGYRINQAFSQTMPASFPGSATKQEWFDDAPAVFPRVTLP
jgi:hypothetical protein